MRFRILIAMVLVPFIAAAQVMIKNASGTKLGPANTIWCASGTTCAMDAGTVFVSSSGSDGGSSGSPTADVSSVSLYVGGAFFGGVVRTVAPVNHVEFVMGPTTGVTGSGSLVFRAIGVNPLDGGNSPQCTCDAGCALFNQYWGDETRVAPPAVGCGCDFSVDGGTLVSLEFNNAGCVIVGGYALFTEHLYP